MPLSEPVKHLHEFIKINMGATYEFVCPAGAEKKYIHRMRVELSRMKKILETRGEIPKHFKMMVINVVPVKNEKKVIITLQKVKSASDVTKEVTDVFKHLSAGEKVRV